MSPSWKESHGHLPATIDPIQLAERGARLTGMLPVKGMPRLAPMCLDGTGDIFVDLLFERGEGEQVFLMHGTLRARLHVMCQRCLEGMNLELEASPWFILARPGPRQDMVNEAPDILVVDKPLLLSVLVEDELLLAMPMVPTHEVSRCPARHYVTSEVARADLSAADKGSKSPFSILSNLKKTR